MRRHFACSWLVALVIGCSHDPDGVGSLSGMSGGDGGDDDGSTGDGDGDGDTDDDGGEATAADDADDGSDVDDGADVSSGDDTAGTATADDGSDSAGSDVGECSNFTSAEQFHSWVNTERAAYAGALGGIPHSRWKGYPWEGEGHENFTFAVQFAWDDALAAQAQAEAESLAAGGAPQGQQQNGSNGLPYCNAAPFWIDGINTADWKISLAEHEEDWMPPPEYPDSCPAPFALAVDNQRARMGLHYHDFGGDGPAINRVGVGAAVGQDCEVWWVLQFGT